MKYKYHSGTPGTPLSPTEENIVDYLKSTDAFVSQDEIVEKLDLRSKGALTVHMVYIRKKLIEGKIITRHGMGYKFVDDVDEILHNRKSKYL